MQNELPPFVQMTQMYLGYATSKVLYVAAKLNIADMIANNGPMTAPLLAEKANVQPDALFRIMRALASVGVFREDSNGEFSMTPLSECLVEDNPQSVKAGILFMVDASYKAYDELLYSVQTGKSCFKKALGSDAFDYLTLNPELGQLFDKFMTEYHTLETAPMLENYDFSSFQTIVDIGGGNGGMITAILKKHENMKGTLFDLPDVIGRAQEALSNSEVKDRITIEGGDFFQSVPSGNDAYIMRHIIHDWSDEDAVTILKNCKKGLNPGGKVLLVEAVIPSGNDPHSYKWLDITMMTIGGKERNEKQFKDIYSKAGLKINRIVPVTPDINVIEGEAV